jgi:sugar O-acyltransferase (sialic acid O-acetyltransferase NeuD family)
MTELLLIGASGLAREVLNVLRAGADTRTVGVLDDLPELWGESIDGAPVLGGLDEVVRHPDAQLILCVGHGSARARIAGRLAGLGIADARFARAIHPTVEVPENCRIGAGGVVLAGVVFTADVQLGRHVVVMPHVTLTHGDRVEDFATLCAGVTLGGDVQIGAEAYLGMNASVRQKVVVGAEATIGMGAVVLSDVPAGQAWVGVPAMQLEVRI